MGRFTATAFVALLALVPGAASARPSHPGHLARVVFVSKPTRVVQGGTATVKVAVSPAVPRCSATLRHGPTASTKYASAQRRTASFSWRIATTAAPGSWTIAVSCGRAGTASTRFTVVSRAPAPVPAKVVVDKSGFSFADSYGTRQLSAGVVLRNVSPDRDAVAVTVTINVIDTGNRILKSDSTTIAAIPAGATYYFGDEFFPDPSTTPARLEINVQTGSSEPKRLSLPPVANLRAVDFYGTTRVEGEFSNPFTKPISQLARITCVVFDGAGNVIGGGFTYPDAGVPPGGRIGFDMSVDGVSLAQVGSVQASVEPETD